MGTTTRTMLAAVTAAALLTGCAGGSEGGDGGAKPSSATSSAGDSTQESPGADESGEDSALDEAAKDAGIDPDNPPEPIASVTMPLSGKIANNEATQATVDLLGLKRDGELLVLTVGFTPKDGKPTSYFGWTGTNWAPQIVDGQNLKVHDVAQLEDANTSIATQTGPASISVGGGDTLYLYAVFGAPPEDVETVTVKVADGAPAVTDVTIR